MTKERRREIRPESLNLLDYLVVDKDGKQGEYSMGRTINVSEGGVLIETHLPLPMGQQVMLTMGLKDELVDVMGRVVHTKTVAGRHQSGIEFFHLARNDKKVISHYVRTFHKLYPEAKDQPLF
ncbi:PilZ domain-containing protein [Desulfolithobacter sp.]